MEKQFKNIIFDLGGVFLTLDYDKTEKAFIDLGAYNFHELYSQQHASHLFRLLETGKINLPDFFDKLRKEGNINANNEEIINAWNAMLGNFPKERLEWLSEKGRQFNVYLFSNTNEIHYNFFSEKFSKENDGKKFEDLFIKAFYSHKLGLRKPEVASYLKVLEEENLNAAETLFIDDTITNIEGAEKAGLQTIFLPKGKTVLDLNF